MIEPKKSLSRSISEDLRAAAGRDGFAQEKGPGVGKGEEEEPAKCFYPWVTSMWAQCAHSAHMLVLSCPMGGRGMGGGGGRGKGG